MLFLLLIPACLSAIVLFGIYPNMFTFLLLLLVLAVVATKSYKPFVRFRWNQKNRRFVDPIIDAVNTDPIFLFGRDYVEPHLKPESSGRDDAAQDTSEPFPNGTGRSSHKG